MAQKVLVDFFGEKVEMFEGNNVLDDIYVVINLLSQGNSQNPSGQV